MPKKQNDLDVLTTLGQAMLRRGAKRAKEFLDGLETDQPTGGKTQGVGNDCPPDCVTHHKTSSPLDNTEVAVESWFLTTLKSRFPTANIEVQKSGAGTTQFIVTLHNNKKLYFMFAAAS